MSHGGISQVIMYVEVQKILRRARIGEGASQAVRCCDAKPSEPAVVIG